MSFFDAIATDDITLNGLEKWSCHMYEQLGWMTLANETGGEDKVSSYLISIKKLKNSIESRLKIITSEDAKLDLENLLSNIKHLIKISSKIFNKEHIRKTICNKCSLPIYDLSEIESKEKVKQVGGKSKTSKLSYKNKLTIPLKKPSKKSSKKLSKPLSKKPSKTHSKKLSKPPSKKLSKKMSKHISKPLSKKPSKISSKKLSKKPLKKNISNEPNNKVITQNNNFKNKKSTFEPIIKKLSKKSITDIYKKISK